MSQPYDTCEHENRHIETITSNYIASDSSINEYETEVYVCDDCGETLDFDIADPVLDRIGAGDE